MYGSINSMQFLISSGANVHATDQLGRTPLHYAAAHDHVKAVEILLNANADANAQTTVNI
jgi:ankyrin repeat protein